MITFEFNTQPGASPLYVQLYGAIKRAIERGEIAGGQKLPSKRALAANAGVSVITVEGAYNQLIAEGYITSAQRKGYFAANWDNKAVGYCPSSEAVASDTFANKSGNTVAFVSEKPDTPGTQEAKWDNNLRPYCPTACGEGDGASDTFGTPGTQPANVAGAAAFPYKAWARCLRGVITRASCGQVTARHDAAGTPELRRAIAAHLLETRGMRVSPRQVVVGAGAQTLYGIIIQLLGRGKIYAAENPGYTRLQKIYQLNDVKFVPVPLDAQGMRVDALTAAGAHVAHVMPQHNLATGAVMRAPRRAQLLAWAAGAPDRYIIEDDYDCQLRFAGRPITPLAAAGAEDAAGATDIANAQNDEGVTGGMAAQKVIYTNTFTKTMGGAFRIGYMVLPPQLAEKFARELAFYSPTVGILDQLALADFITSGAYARHVRRVRTQLKKTCAAFTSALNWDNKTVGNSPTPTANWDNKVRCYCPSLSAKGVEGVTGGPATTAARGETSNPFTVEGVGAGAHFILKAPANLAPAVMAAAPAAAALGVKLTPLSAYFMEPQPAATASSPACNTTNWDNKVRCYCPTSDAEGSEGSVGVNSRDSAIPEAKPSGVAESAGIRYAEGVTGKNAAASDTFANQTNANGICNIAGTFTVDCTAATPESAARAATLLTAGQ